MVLFIPLKNLVMALLNELVEHRIRISAFQEWSFLHTASTDSGTEGNVFSFLFEKLPVKKSGWSEPAPTSVPVQDEAVQVVLGMNQKRILFPYQGIFFGPSSAPKISPPTYLPPSYLPHLISHSLHLQSSGELPSLNSTELQGDMRHKA